jgi:hypothetical protein
MQYQLPFTYHTVVGLRKAAENCMRYENYTFSRYALRAYRLYLHAVFYCTIHSLVLKHAKLPNSSTCCNHHKWMFHAYARFIQDTDGACSDPVGESSSFSMSTISPSFYFTRKVCPEEGCNAGYARWTFWMVDDMASRYEVIIPHPQER